MNTFMRFTPRTGPADGPASLSPFATQMAEHLSAT